MPNEKPLSPLEAYRAKCAAEEAAAKKFSSQDARETFARNKPATCKDCGATNVRWVPMNFNGWYLAELAEHDDLTYIERHRCTKRGNA